MTGAALALAACNPAEPEPTRDATAASEPVPATPAVASQAGDTALPKAGDSYWTARKSLLAAGFAPIDAPEPVDGTQQDLMVCPEEMEQQRYLDECPSTKIALVEVEACAGTGMGNCRTEWRAPDGRRLTIFTVDGPQPGVVQNLEWAVD